MANAFVVFAVYLSLSLGLERFTRSGDLDRGLPDHIVDPNPIKKSFRKTSSNTKSVDFDNNTYNPSVNLLILNARSEELDVTGISLRNRQNPAGTLESTGGNSFVSSVPLDYIDLNEINVFNSSVALKRRLELSTEFFLVPTVDIVSTEISKQSVEMACAGCNVETTKIIVFFRNEVWVVPVLSLSAVSMTMIVGFEVFVVCKVYRNTPSRRHLFLGQMLLLGLFSCSALAAVFTASPTQLTCAIIRFGTGVANAIIFASLLVKCVFLVSLNGGVYLPAPYQGLLLLFAILIQVAIGVQWLLTNPPTVDEVLLENLLVKSSNNHKLLVTIDDLDNQTVQMCRTPFIDMILSLTYVIFLIMFVTVLAVKSRDIRDNYREATYIGMSVGCTIPIWIIWTMAGFFVHERYKDACIAFGLVVSSSVIFLIMFMPKGRQLSAMGKEGIYIEDREERYSYLSYAGSGNSPSFFHFKPVKYELSNGSSLKVIPGITTLDQGNYFFFL
ncbi:hypothetical protein HHI36_023903 [Cryptolaemus montrouzieri]|uniref:G-protein coupled receptors family 3 profile domain-containing protein n=1 Tax=Cryptolaemus montrouzieri TaxID=559131 RepID=A0ABD2NQ00_9CUCU